MSIPQNIARRVAIWCAVSSKIQAADDKISMEMQENEGRAWCEANNCRVVAVLKVPGHSRRNARLVQALEEFRKDGCYAFDELEQLWDTRGFDIFLGYDPSRIARNEVLYHHVTDNTLAIAEIHFIHGGKIAGRFDNAMHGAKAASDVDSMVEKRRAGMSKNAEKGLPTSPRIPYSHILIRDPQNGRALRLEVDETKRQLWHDVATELLNGTPWLSMEHTLWEKYRHGRDGKPFPQLMIRSVMYSSIFWGWIARNYRARYPKSPIGQQSGAWLWDETIPVPDGVEVHRTGKVPPVYTGDLAERVKAEMTRRIKAVRNHPYPVEVHRFSGLVVCDECNYLMTTLKKENGTKTSTRTYLRCAARQKTFARARQCGQSKMIREEKVQAAIHELLEQIVEAESVISVLAPRPNEEKTALESRIAQLDKSIAVEAGRAARLVEKQASAPASLADTYDAEITRIGERLELLKSERAKVAAQTPRERPEQASALQDLREMGLERFWAQDNLTVNQMLVRLFGDYRLLVHDGEVIGCDLFPGRKMYRRRSVKS